MNKQSNYMQVGRTFECSNCKPEKGYADYHKEIKCECICHQEPKQLISTCICGKCPPSKEYTREEILKGINQEPKASWEEEYPLNTFTGETKKELIDCIKSILSSTKQQIVNEIEKVSWTDKYRDKYAELESVLSIIKSKYE